MKVECEHQLEIERDKNEELVRLKVAADERCLAAESRTANVEAAYTEYRQEYEKSPDANMKWKVMVLEDQLKQANELKEKAISSKKRSGFSSCRIKISDDARREL